MSKSPKWSAADIAAERSISDRVLRKLSGIAVGFPRKLYAEITGRLFPNTPKTLRCGVSIVPDRRVKKWRQIAQNGFHELDVDQFLADYLHPGDVVFDVGASIGALTAVAAKSIAPLGAVHSFEVDGQSFAHLQETIRRNKLGNVVSNNIALSDTSGEATFIRPSSSWGAFMLSSTDGDEANAKRRAIDEYFPGEDESKYTSRTTTIDEYIRANSIDRLDLIKIDVDGPEPAVIRGGSEAIARFQPAIMAEASMFTLDHGVSFSELFDLISSFGYWIYAARRDTAEVRRLLSADEAPIDIQTEKRAIDLFCRMPGKEDTRWESLWFIEGTEDA